LKKSILGAALTVAALCLGALAPLSAAGATGAAGAGPSPLAQVALPGGVPQIPAGVKRLGPVPSAQVLHLEVGLAGEDPTGLAAEVTAVSTPGSPTYRHYLTSAQFAAAYGPSPAEVQQVSASLRAEGLTVGTPTLGSALLPVSGSAATVSTVFGTPLQSVRLPGGLTSQVNTAVPKVPAALAADITGIVGLSGLSEEHSMLRHDEGSASAATGSTAAAASGSATPAASTADGAETAHTQAPQACSAAARTAGQQSYTSTQLADAYGLSQLFDQGRTGSGQTIGIVEFEKFSNTDISTFEACYGLSNPTRTVTVDGPPSGSPSGSGEAALDIELAAVNAPSASIIVYEAPNETSDASALDLYDRIASDDQAQVVSTSWGFCEQDNEPGGAVQENTIFERMAAQGQTMVAASGDSGSEDCYDTDGGTELSVDDPGTQPDVTSVGGTTLAAGAVASQTVWNNCLSQRLGFCQIGSENGAGGGGFSSVWPRPSWQPAPAAGTDGTEATDGPGGRIVPDLSLSADPHNGVTVYFGGWGVFGGTSAVAPTIAGFLADTNQGCNSGVGMVNPALYAAAASGGGADFTPVTSGNNDFTGTNGGDYAAASAFNPATGLGTPQEQNLAQALQGAGGCPTVTGLSQGSGPASGAGAITVNGSGLGSATAVSFGAAGSGTIVSKTATSVVVVPPAPGKALCVNVSVTNPQGTSVSTPAASFAFGGPGCSGYRFVASDGGIFDFGAATFQGSAGNLPLAQPIVGMATTPSGNGYWLVASDGGIFSFGDAQFFGSTGATHLNQPIVGMAATPDGNGYWLVASDGGIFSFGDAHFLGSTGAIRLNQPIVGMTPTPDGGGYWLVASDGGIFSFGDAAYFGSTGGIHLNQPIVAMAATPNGGGYWLVAADGGIFTFGNASFFGSTGAIRLNQPIVGMAASTDGGGYLLVAADGGVFTFGDAQFFGSAGALHLNRPIVGLAVG
jgi:Pro-kumamolisin, activation domain